jgi:hypothetical protein
MGPHPIHSVGSRVVAKDDISDWSVGDYTIPRGSPGIVIRVFPGTGNFIVDFEGGPNGVFLSEELLARSPLDSMDIKFYAIRQKSTGYFLPHHFRELTGPYTKDEPLPTCMPRPFKTAVAARLALTAWLKGRWGQTIESVYDSCYDPPEEVYMPSPPDRRDFNRNPADMEVVEIRLGSIRPIP